MISLHSKIVSYEDQL